MAARLARSTALLLAGLAASTLVDARERTLRVDRNELVNTGGWTLIATTAPGAAPVAAAVPFRLVFERKTVAVEDGCSALRGDYTLTGKRMAFALAATVGQDCTGDAAKAAAAFLDALDRDFEAELVEPLPYRLRLTADDGTVLEFQSQPMRF